jgi:tRNA:m4X modification enzyme
MAYLKRDRCEFYLPIKKRYCSQKRLDDDKFCGVHADRGSDERISCPIDQSHEIWRKDLSSHIRKCNATKDLAILQKLPYFSKGINSGSITDEEKHHVDAFRLFVGLEKEEDVDKDDDDEEEEEEYGTIDVQISTTEKFDRQGGYITRLIHSPFLSSQVDIRSVYERLLSWILVAESTFRGDLSVYDKLVAPNIEKYVNTSQKAGASIKGRLRQTLQEASIVSLMFLMGLLNTPDDSTFIDLGAGKANLSLALHHSVPNSKLLLVERQGGASRGAADTSFRRVEFQNFTRLRIDLADFDLSKIGYCSGNVVGIGKHVCGNATDLSLRCLEQALMCKLSDVSLDASRKCFLKGICIATCCHHRCTWEDYVGKTFFKEKLGGSAVEFEVLRLLSSWALMGGEERGSDFPKLVTYADIKKKSVEEWERSLSRKERIQIGRAAKRVIDAGRVDFLETLGLNAKQAFYCNQELSPENSLIIGCKKG